MRCIEAWALSSRMSYLKPLVCSIIRARCLSTTFTHTFTDTLAVSWRSARLVEHDSLVVLSPTTARRPRTHTCHGSVDDTSCISSSCEAPRGRRRCTTSKPEATPATTHTAHAAARTTGHAADVPAPSPASADSCCASPASCTAVRWARNNGGGSGGDGGLYGGCDFSGGSGCCDDGALGSMMGGTLGGSERGGGCGEGGGGRGRGGGDSSTGSSSSPTCRHRPACVSMLLSK